MLTRDGVLRLTTLLMRIVASVLIAIVAAPRLARIGGSVWWTLMPWALLALGWGILIVRWRRYAGARCAGQKAATHIDAS